MDAEKTLTSIQQAKLLAQMDRVIKPFTRVWDTNRAALVDFMLDEDDAGAVSAVEIMPKEVDKLIQEIMQYREKLFDIAFAMGS